MHFEAIDALVLQCIFRCDTREKGANLRDIIGYGDYVDHSILSWKEIETAATKLVGAGLISLQDKNFCTLPAFRLWHKKKFQGKKTITAYKEAGEILKFLQENFSSVNAAPITGLAETDYNEALKQYMNPGK